MSFTARQPNINEKTVMKGIFKQIVKKTPLHRPLKQWVEKRGQLAEIAKWEEQGKPAPPPHVIKQQVLREYARSYRLRTLVETGTFYGDMVEALRAEFDHIYSVELSQDLYEKAVKRFKGAHNVEIIHGDSGGEVGKLMDRIKQPILFWLDGHYSGGVTARGDRDTPVYEELHHILKFGQMGHVIIIDDARLFGTNPAYPSVTELSEFIKSRVPDVNIIVQDDSIRITPKEYA